jgi:hypothetical protein
VIEVIAESKGENGERSPIKWMYLLENGNGGEQYPEQRWIILVREESDKGIVFQNDNQVFHIEVRDWAIISPTEKPNNLRKKKY